jgi:hypothetical protein
MAEVLYSFPAYSVVECPRSWRRELDGEKIPVFRAGDELALISDPRRHYQLGSVASYAISNDSCPIEAVERARGFGHELHYAFALGSSIVSHDRERVEYYGVEIGDKIRFEGRVFELVAQPNNNIGLKPVA